MILGVEGVAKTSTTLATIRTCSYSGGYKPCSNSGGYKQSNIVITMDTLV